MDGEGFRIRVPKGIDSQKIEPKEVLSLVNEIATNRYWLFPDFIAEIENSNEIEIGISARILPNRDSRQRLLIHAEENPRNLTQLFVEKFQQSNGVEKRDERAFNELIRFQLKFCDKDGNWHELRANRSSATNSPNQQNDSKDDQGKPSNQPESSADQDDASDQAEEAKCDGTIKTDTATQPQIPGTETLDIEKVMNTIDFRKLIFHCGSGKNKFNIRLPRLSFSVPQILIKCEAKVNFDKNGNATSYSIEILQSMKIIEDIIALLNKILEDYKKAIII